MNGIRQNSIHLFRLAGVDVSLHWSWFLVAAYEISDRSKSYSSITWNVLEYLALFLIVLLHEYGHSLACRQVGGVANQIVLWPLGGVAYVNPPPRPGATLWSIAAGPLVNVALVLVFKASGIIGRAVGMPLSTPDAFVLLRNLAYINLFLLGFNILPIYPLDGGQILRSLLWYVLGRARSLMAATIVGFIGAAGLIYLAIKIQDLWFGFMCAFIVLNCWTGFKQARIIYRLENTPRRNGYNCPSCKAAPVTGNRWACSKCGKSFDTFETQAVCPQCAASFPLTACTDCGRMHSMQDWAAAALAPVVPNT